MAAISYKELYNLVDKRLEKFENGLDTRFVEINKTLKGHSKELKKIDIWRSGLVPRLAMVSTGVGIIFSFIWTFVWNLFNKHVLKND